MVIANGTTCPKVLATDKICADGLDILKPHFQVDSKTGLSESQICSIIGDYSALLVRSETQVTAAIINAGTKLAVIARAGVGVDNIDVAAATARGIIVVNSPTGNIAAAAEHTIALLMALARHIPKATASLKSAKWERSKLVGVEVRKKILGIIGLGKGIPQVHALLMIVGMHVARCATGLGMKVIATDPYASPELAKQNNVELTSLSEVLSRCHFLSVHAPLIASTKGLIGAEELAQLQPGARVLNVARGGIIEEQALLEALESGHIAGAAIDVFTSEPPSPNSSATHLIAHPNVVATPHLGASTAEAQVLVGVDVCQQILSILSGELPSSAVNAPIILPEELKRLQPYVSLVEKMGDLYIQHYQTQHHHFEIVFEGAIAEINTKPLYAALIRGLTKSVSESTVNIVNASLVAKERGIIVSENHSRESSDLGTYSSLITLKARGSDQLISGFVSEGIPQIVRLDRFTTAFIPEGHLLICHNYDRPGMIGKVGGILGVKGVNISYMSVAPVIGKVGRAGEALMILGVDRRVEQDVLKEIEKTEGIVDVKLVNLG